VLVYPFFEPTRLLTKKAPHWSFLLCFFRLSKHEKSPSFPSLGSLNLHRRTLPLCVYQPHLHPLPIRLVTVCVCVLTPLATGGFFRVSFPRTSVLSSCLALVCLRSSFLPCNVIFFYSFQLLKKNKKIKYTPKRGWEKYFLC
jgi:hypothetical protein